MVILSMVVIMITTKLYWMLSATGSKDEKAKALPPGIKLLDAATAAGFGGCHSDMEPSIAASEDQGQDGDDDDMQEYDAEGYFCDLSFAPGLDALGNMTGDSANKTQGKVDRWQEDMLPGWARPHQMMGENRTKTHQLHGMEDVQPRLFGLTAPNDLRQGAIGDCWLITAMSSIAEFPALVQRLFKQTELAEDGRYDIRLYEEEGDKWHVLTIDDRLPFVKKPGYYGRTLFCKPSLEGEFWPCLLEKAFAKFLHGYWRLEGGFTGVALVALTGKPSIFFTIGQGDPHQAQDFFYGAEWEQSAHKCILMRNPGKDKGWSTWYGELDQAVWDPIEEEPLTELDDDTLWDKLKGWDEAGYIMGASSRCDYQGVISGHAYSIIQVIEVGVEGHDDYDTLRLLKIRNPHAGNEWTGPFSDADEDSWNAHPEALEACEHEVGENNDGFFWMPFDEFKNGYSLMCLNLQSGSELPRYDEIEEGHEFDEDQLKVDGHAWEGEPAEDDEDSEDEIEGGATGGDDEEAKALIEALVESIQALWMELLELPPGDERKEVVKSIARKNKRLAAAVAALF